MGNFFDSSSISKYHRSRPIKDFDVNQTMYNMIYNESKNDMNLSAVSFLGGKMTYGELFSSADKLAKAFYDDGIREGDAVAIMTISMPIVQECLLALSKIGATMVFIDLRIKEKDLIKNINDSNCKTVVVFEDMLSKFENIINETDVSRVIVCSPKDYLPSLVRVLANLKDKKDGKKIVLPSDERFVRTSDFVKDVSDYNSLNPIGFDKERPSIIVGSSGSTGKPKQIVHTEYNFNFAALKMAYTDLPFYKGDTMYVAIPPFIIYGLGNSIYASMAFTMNALMTPYVSDETVYNDLGKFDISLAAPLHYRYIYNKICSLQKDIELLEKDNNKSELKIKYKELKRIFDGIKKVNTFVSGGDKISEDELLMMERLFDKSIVNGYGNNESVGASIVSPRFANKPGSIGIPMYGVDIKIVDPDTLVELKQGFVGELYVSTSNLFMHYLNNKVETDKIKFVDSNGKEWVRTGDLAKIDDDGFIIHMGRNRRLINKSAFKISPNTIEDVISCLDFVRDCVVVGVHDLEHLSVPMAFIELNDGVNFDDVIDIIKNKCNIDLPDYEIPSYFYSIDKIPYTPNHKQDFRALEVLGNEFVKSKQKKLV